MKRCLVCGTFNLMLAFALALPAAAQTKPAPKPASQPTSRPTSAPQYTVWPFDSKEAARRQDEAAKALGIPKETAIDLGNGIAMKFVLIPAGTFMMGSADNERDRYEFEGPQHEVTITTPFYLAVCKVTHEQYRQVMGKSTSKITGGKNFPIDTVTWEDATEFCKRVAVKRGKPVRLPTEAEWEHACRAGTATRFYFGDDESKLGEFAWFRDNVGGQMHAVGLKKPNAWGLYDMHGLMWEWCSDFYANYPDTQKATDPKGPATGTTHSCRGGTWGSRVPFVRTAIRIGAGPPGIAINDRFGMRVAMDTD